MTTASKAEYTAAELDAKARQAIAEVDGIDCAGAGIYSGWTVCIGEHGAYLRVPYKKMNHWASPQLFTYKELMIEL